MWSRPYWRWFYLNLLLVSRMGRTISRWQPARKKDLQWPLAPGAPTAGPKLGKSWKLSCTMITHHPLGQHNDLSCHSPMQLSHLKLKLLSDVDRSVINLAYLFCTDCLNRVSGAVGPSAWRCLKTSLWHTAVSWWVTVNSQNQYIHTDTCYCTFVWFS